MLCQFITDSIFIDPSLQGPNSKQQGKKANIKLTDF